MGEKYEIGDGTGKSFQIFIDLPRKSVGYWRTIDKGFIKYNSGKVYQKKHPGSGFFYDLDAFLYSKDGTWGMRLDKISGMYFLNDQGEGQLLQPWVLIAKPGTISWVKV